MLGFLKRLGGWVNLKALHWPTSQFQAIILWYRSSYLKQSQIWPNLFPPVIKSKVSENCFISYNFMLAIMPFYALFIAIKFLIVVRTLEITYGISFYLS